MSVLLVLVALAGGPALAQVEPDFEQARSAEEICRKGGHEPASAAFRQCVARLLAGDPMTLRPAPPEPAEPDPMLRGANNPRRRDNSKRQGEFAQ